METKRKHHTKMSPAEIQMLLGIVRKLDLSYSSHARDRQQQKNVSDADIRAAISYGSIVEAHNNINNELRVMVRGKVRGDFVCVAVSITTSNIVTAYWNKRGDHHQTLDAKQYQWDVILTDLPALRPELFPRG